MADASVVTDAELIARSVVGDDRHAFTELVRRHQSSVRACLRRLTTGNHALADDLAQETFILAWRNLKAFRQEARFSTWLYRIATNCWLAHSRKRKEELLGDRDPGDRPQQRQHMLAPRGQRRGRRQRRHHARRKSVVRNVVLRSVRAERPIEPVVPRLGVGVGARFVDHRVDPSQADMAALSFCLARWICVFTVPTGQPRT